MAAPLRDGAAVASALVAYRARVLPQTRRELQDWRQVATTIPDPARRGQALAALDQKGLNVEAAAVFAILAPRRTRAGASSSIGGARAEGADAGLRDPGAVPRRRGSV